MSVAQPLEDPASRSDAAVNSYLIMLIFAVGATFRITYLTSSFILTVSPFACVYFLYMHRLHEGWSQSQVAWLVLAAGLIVFYPIFVFLLDVVIGGPVIPVSRFLSSYGLWVANFGMLAVAAIGPAKGDPRDLGHFAYWALILIAGFGLLQSVFVNVLGSDILYNIWGSRNYFEINYPLYHYFFNGLFRAPSFYYEPSIFGRFCVCLGATCVITDYKPLVSIALAAMGAVVSVSAGSIMMLGCVVLLWCLGYAERPAKTHSVISLIVMICFFSIPFLNAFVFNRLAEINTTGYVSGFVRVLLPLVVIVDVLRSAPLGAPVGSNEMLSLSNPLFYRFSGTETKITSGVYEFIIYTGYAGILLFAVVAVLVVRRALSRQWRSSMVLFIMLTATIVSSSFLAFESTIQLLPVLIALRLMGENEGDDEYSYAGGLRQ